MTEAFHPRYESAREELIRRVVSEYRTALGGKGLRFNKDAVAAFEEILRNEMENLNTEVRRHSRAEAELVRQSKPQELPSELQRLEEVHGRIQATHGRMRIE